MKKLMIFGVAALPFALSACGEGGEPQQQNSASTTNTAAAQSGDQVFSGRGDVTAISGDGVTISHGPIEGIGWPAMTMTFKAGSPQMTQGINVGDPVAFEFRQSGSEYTLTSLNKAS